MADDEVEEVYSIEKIVKKKITKDGKIKYFLKWKDYPDSDNTWEMAEDLDCNDLIEKFEEELAKNGDPVMEDSESEEEEDEEGEDAVSEPPEEQIEADQASAAQDDPLDEPITTDDPLGEDEGGVASLSPSEQPMSEENSQPITEESSPPPSPSRSTTFKRPASGFEKGYSVETIIGITPRKTGKYAFLIKWKESTEPTLEEREVCNMKCPQKIIRFYEKRLVWMKG